MVVLRYIPVVIIANSDVEEYLKEESEVENGKIKPIFGWADFILHTHINTKNPKRLD
jgi:hypothetical protein